MLSNVQRRFKKERLAVIRDLNKIPKHLYEKWWREHWVLFDNEGRPVWPAGLPDNIPYKIICKLYREAIMWTQDSTGLYKPENLGTINLDYSSDYDS